MPKTVEDFLPAAPEWICDEWIKLGHRCIDTAPAGNFKTTFGCWLAVNIAAGNPVFGCPVYQGNTMIIDEETPMETLENILNRFCWGIGVKNYHELPIYVHSMQGFRFTNKQSREDMLALIDAWNPVFLRMDSLTAMGPDDPTQMHNNKVGNLLRDFLGDIVKPGRTVMLSAHTGKNFVELPIEHIRDMSIVSLTKGSTSIIEEGCDTGFIVKKISEHPRPSRFWVKTVSRRGAIHRNNELFIEIVEEEYGHGWAVLETRPPVKPGPSDITKHVFRLFQEPDGKGNYAHTSTWIKKQVLFTAKETWAAIQELLFNYLVNDVGAQKFELNPKYKIQCDPEYLAQLQSTNLPPPPASDNDDGTSDDANDFQRKMDRMFEDK